ncbi:MAG: four-carbon acid sugar kinase family protein [Thermomicrobiales bacterium]
MTQVAIIADDLTGAADSGASFAVQWFTTTISFVNSPLPEVDVLIRSTESRHSDLFTAVQSNHLAAKTLTDQFGFPGPQWVYKKIDSAMRGHPCEELLAVMTELGESSALVAPALPSEARMTIGGRQHVGDKQLGQGSWHGSSATSNLVDLFSCQHAGMVQVLDLETVRRGTDAVEQFLGEVAEGIVIADAQSDADLFVLASAAVRSNFRVLCGSAGFARQLARVLPLNRSQQSIVGTGLNEGPVLVVAGSLHPATGAQVDFLRREGLPIVRPDQAHLDELSSSVDGPAREVAAHVEAGRSVLLTTAGLNPSKLGSSFVASRLADIVVESMVGGRLGGLVLTGGDVAARTLARMGASAMHLGGEVRPAMPWGIVISALAPSLPTITKAGSFGAEDALEACLDFLADFDGTRTSQRLS